MIIDLNEFSIIYIGTALCTYQTARVTGIFRTTKGGKWMMVLSRGKSTEVCHPESAKAAKKSACRIQYRHRKWAEKGNLQALV